MNFHWGYIRTNYEDAVSSFNSAISDVEFAASSAKSYCGGSSNASIEKLEKYMLILFNENKKLKEKIKTLENR